MQQGMFGLQGAALGAGNWDTGARNGPLCYLWAWSWLEGDKLLIDITRVHSILNCEHAYMGETWLDKIKKNQ